MSYGKQNKFVQIGFCGEARDLDIELSFEPIKLHCYLGLVDFLHMIIIQSAVEERRQHKQRSILAGFGVVIEELTLLKAKNFMR